ncbi:MAG: hypothetical protein YYHSYBAR_000645 [Candidatus Fervidibacter sacchari]
MRDWAKVKLSSNKPPFQERETDWVKGGYVGDVVAVSVQVNEDASMRLWLLNPFLRRSGQKAAEAPVGLNFPEQHPHPFPHAHDAHDDGDKVTALQLFLDNFSALWRQFRQIPDQANFSVHGVPNADVSVWVGQGEAAVNLHLPVTSFFADCQPQNPLLLEKPQLLWVKPDQFCSLLFALHH